MCGGGAGRSQRACRTRGGHDPTPPLRPHHPPLRRPSALHRHPPGLASPAGLARGGDYLTELRATYRRDRGIFALVRESGVVVMGCSQTLPVVAAVFRALGWEVDEGA